MKRSNRLVILVGVLLAVLAFAGVVILLNQQASVVEEPPTTATVLVATRDIGVNEEISVDDAESKEVDLGAIVGTPLSDVSQVAGRRSLYNVARGEQITEETVGLGGGTDSLVDLAGQLGPGERAVSLQVDRATGLDFLLRPGDVVDVVISEELTGGVPGADAAPETIPELFPQFAQLVPDSNDQRTVKAVIQNRRVLYVSDTRNQPVATPDPNAPANGAGAAPAETPIENVIVVIAATSQEAEILKFSQRDVNELGNISLILRSPDDTEPAVTTGITLRRLVDDYGVLVPISVQPTDDNT